MTTQSNPLSRPAEMIAENEGTASVPEIPPFRRFLAFGIPVAIVGWFCYRVVELSATKYFALDEFQYSHAAWLLARGFVPYRDFFEHHFPMSYQLLSPIFLFAGDDPRGIAWLRMGMLAVVGVAGVCVWRLNAAWSTVCAWMGPAFLMSTALYAARGSEIRPDSVGCTAFLLALALLVSERATGLRAFVAGLFAFAAVWSTQKAVYYESIFGLAFLVDIARMRVKSEERLLGRPWHFLAGAACGGLVAITYLWQTGALSACYHWCVRWALFHEKHYPEASWLAVFGSFAAESPGLFVFALGGVVATIARIARSPKPALGNRELLLCFGLLSTFNAAAMLSSQFDYNLIPFAALLAVFGGRGATGLWSLAGVIAYDRRALRLAVQLPVAGALLAAGIHADRALQKRMAFGNSHQREVLAAIAELTNADDPVYDNSGGYVARPHAYYMFFTDAVIRQHDADMLVREVPSGRPFSNAACTAAVFSTAQFSTVQRRHLAVGEALSGFRRPTAAR
jgi:hypothetical protein